MDEAQKQAIFAVDALSWFSVMRMVDNCTGTVVARLRWGRCAALLTG